MAVRGSTGSGPRRTQSERRTATRAALLDATISGLIEHGYARLTTAQIVASAGVTRGAQAHYFSTKAELVVEALERLAAKLAADFTARPVAANSTPRQQYGALLDRLWALHRGELFEAATELWVAARTDVELRTHLFGFAGTLRHSITTRSAELAPLLAEREDYRELVTAAMSSISGLALFRFLSTPRQVNVLWAGVRRQLLTLVDDH